MMSTQQKTDVNVIALVNNSWSNAAIDDEGRVWTWGNDNTSYRLGRSSSVAANTVNPYNRGGQVTTTIYPDINLPYTLQISGSVENTLALDRDGAVWSWGTADDSALGRTGSRGLPGKVAFPDGVKIKWVSAAYHGGKAVDTDGNLWVWGYGYQYGLGTGSTNNASTPVKLTLDSDNKPLPTNFIKVHSSDYRDQAAAIAVTSDGKIFTWGNNGVADRGGAQRPKQTGTNNDIYKITCGNGTYGFLTNSGEIWTWGENRRVAGPGRQGHGDTDDRSAPKRVESFVSGGIIPAPKIRDFSIYAWSACAVDYDGNIYGIGENLNNKHTGAGIPNRFTKYLPNGIPADTKIFVVAEGYTSTSYIDIYGNAYVTGNTSARGNNSNDGSVAGPWVHFTGSGKPMFTVLSSSPTSEAKRYNTTPKTTLHAETNISTDEVKYVILNPDDTDTYTDGETFYSKSFAEIEPPYYLKGTNPQLLLSPNHDLWSSRYYANPKISEDVFNAIYNIKSSSEKGLMEPVAGTSNKVYEKPDLVSHNCIVWIQSKNAYGTTRALYRFDNYYTQTKVWVEGVKSDNPSYALYQPELVGGGYGLFLDRNGKLIPGVPPFGYDNVMPEPKALTYWTLAPATQTDKEVAADGYTHRVDRSKEVFLTELSQMGDDEKKTPRVTFTYEKNPAMWVNADLHFVNEKGEPVEVMIDGKPATSEHREKFAPKGAEHVEGQDPYLPPDASNPLTKVVGYSVGTAPNDTPDSYLKCSFPEGFKPKLDATTDIYIVYTSGMVSITETFIDISSGGKTAIANNDGLYSAIKNLRQNMDDYDAAGPAISGYVIVGHETKVGEAASKRVDYTWGTDRYTPQNAKIPAIGDNSTVQFFYKPDSNGNNIPDEEEGTVRVRWIAVNANNVAYRITEKTIYGNGKWNATTTINHDKDNVLPTALYNPGQWIFRPGQTGDPAPYQPQGSSGTENIIFTIGDPQNVYFYYDEDYNINGIADKSEGFFTEKYKLFSPRGDLTPPKADTNSKWLGGHVYSSTAPLVADYVAVGYVIEADGKVVDSLDRVSRDKTGNVSIAYTIPFTETKQNYTVTFLYKEDKNNNDIPDDEEGSVTVSWIGKTFAGNTVELAKIVIVGYVGDDVANRVALPNPIDDVWKPAGNNVPKSIILSNTPQSYAYQYTEALEFATIVVESVSTDKKLEFRYQYTKKLTDEAFTVKAFEIPTYRVTGYTLYDNYDKEVKSDTGDTVKIDPSTGSQKVVFHYVSTITTVVIRAVDTEDTMNILKSQTITDATIGQKYAATAPYVDNSWILKGDLLQVIDVAEGTNYITFEYEKATGNITILLKEKDANGQIIQVRNDDVTKGNKKTIQIPNLSAAYYTPISTAAIDVDYSGASPTPDPVEFYYSKDMMNVAIKAVDKADSSELKTETLPAIARKGESYTAVAPTIEWHTIAEPNSKIVYVDPNAANNTIPVTFQYDKDHIGDISVKLFYKDEAGKEAILDAYNARSVVGTKFTALAGSFPGFSLKSANAVEIIVDADSGKNSIAFEYTDQRKTVGVFTQIEADEKTRQKISEQKYVSGSETTLIPPYMKDHLVVGYIINSDVMVPVNPESFTGLPLTGGMAITSDMSIVFVYAPVAKIVETRYVDVTIQGVTGGITHYSYDKRIAKSDLPITLTFPADVFDVPGYRLDDKSDFTVTTATTEKVFHYRSLATTVMIRMVDGTGADVAGSFAVAATADAPFTYNAPNVPDYYLTGSSLGKVNPVLADGSSEIVFTYGKITSKVTMVAKEDDTNGRVIGVFEVKNPTEGTAAYNVPDLTGDFYTAKKQTVDIAYDGTNSVIVEVFYTKDRVPVQIEAVEYLTGADLGAQPPLLNQRKGEAVTVSAPNIANYLAVGNATQIVIADGASKAVFKYKPLSSDEVLVKAVDTAGNILQSYVLKGIVGETVSADPPVLLGWKTSDTAKSAKIGTDSEIVFTYTKNVVTVTINTVDASGNPLGTSSVEVAKGGSYTAYAPHIFGYVLDGNGTHAFTNLAADEIVTFVYKTAVSEMVTVTVIGKDVQGELYRYTVLRSKNSGVFDVNAREVEGYRLLSTTPASVDVKDDDITVAFDYQSILTTVRINMIEEGSPDYLAIFDIQAVTGESFTYNAPNIAGYYLTSASTIGKVSPVLPNGASEINFTYKKIESNVVIAARENDTNGRVIRVFPQAEQSAVVNAPDLTADFYTAIAPTVSITYDGTDSVSAEAYYRKDAVAVPIKAVDCISGTPLTATPSSMPNQRRGESVTVSAPIVSGYVLSGDKTQTVVADGSDVVFTFCKS